MVRDLDVSRAEQLLRQAETASAAFLDALTDEIAIIDNSGTIIAVNDAWKRFSSTEGDSNFDGPGVGQNYLDVCERSAAAGVEDARKVLDGLRGVLRKTANQFLTEYEFVTPQSRRWFLLTATALAQMPGALVSHRDITGGRKAEEALRLGGRYDAGGPLYDSFLPALVKNLAAALGVRHAFVVEVIDGKTRAARLLAHWDGVSFEESREYTISGLPSEQVLEGRTSIFPSGVRRLFPDDELLARMEAESYMAVPLLDSRGDPLGYLGILDTKPIEDVSFAETTLRVFASPATPELERRRVQRRLEEQSRLIYYTADAVVGTDTDFVITYWNNAARELYGWAEEEVIGRPARDVLRTEYSDEERERAIKTITEEGQFRGQVVQYRKDGSPIHVGATTMAIQGPNGGVRGFVSVNRDVSEEVRLREALAESERRNKALLEAMPDMLFTVNARGRFLSFMPARDLRPFVPPEDFLGKTVEEILPLDVAHALVSAVGFCLRTGEAQTVEYQLDGDGGTMDFEARIVTLGADEVLAIVRDRTREANRERAIVSRDNRVRVSRNGELPSVLVVDRDMRSLRLLRRLLEGAGKRVVVTTDADEAFGLAEKERPDVFLVDLPVFESDGTGFLSELRRLSAAPVLVYGTADDEERAIAALRAGADDFITRPFSAAELAARVDLALRHSRSGQPFLAVPLDFGDLVIDPSSRVVTVSGKQAALTSTEYRLLLELAEAAGRVMTHDEILERVWGPGYAGQHEVLRAFVRTLRKKLGDEARHSRFLVSERGVGYKMARAG